MYTLRLSRQAEKYIKKQDRTQAKRLRDAIDKIKEDPHIDEFLTNHENEYKFRVGDYRILYDVNETEVIISVVKVMSRGQSYKR